MKTTTIIMGLTLWLAPLTVLAQTKEEGARVHPPTVITHKTHNSITIKAVPQPSNGQVVEYAIMALDSIFYERGFFEENIAHLVWQTGLIFTELNAGTPHGFLARSQENSSYYAGYINSADLAVWTKISASPSTEPVPPIITTASLPSGTIGEGYSTIFTATGDMLMIWGIDNGSLPEGLQLYATGSISGTPKNEGTFNFTVRALNSAGSDTKPLSIVVNAGSTNTLLDSIALLHDSIGGLHQQLTTCNTQNSSLNDTITARDNRIVALLNNISALQNDTTKLQDSIRELWRLLNECRSGTSNAAFMLESQLEIFPNPVINELRITIDELRIGEIVELFDINGRRVFSQRIPVETRHATSPHGDTFTINMSQFQPGNYILRIGNRVAKIVKQ